MGNSKGYNEGLQLLSRRSGSTSSINLKVKLEICETSTPSGHLRNSEQGSSGFCAASCNGIDSEVNFMHTNSAYDPYPLFELHSNPLPISSHHIQLLLPSSSVVVVIVNAVMQL